jgi:hypothetical protein
MNIANHPKKSEKNSTVRNIKYDRKPKTVTSTNLIPYKCEFCTREFDNLRGYSAHRSKMRGNGDLKHLEDYEEVDQEGDENSTLKNYVCQFCDYSYNHMSGLYTHMNSNHLEYLEHKDNVELERKRLGNYECALCNEIYAQRSSLARHLRKKHREQYDFVNLSGTKCPKCDKEFKSLNALKTHYSCMHSVFHVAKKTIPEVSRAPHGEGRSLQIQGPIISKSEELSFDCKICNASYKFKTSLNRHLRQNHAKIYNSFTDKDIPTKCGICHKDCKSERGLKIHIAFAHKDIIEEPNDTCLNTPYICSEPMESKVQIEDRQDYISGFEDIDLNEDLLEA